MKGPTPTTEQTNENDGGGFFKMDPVERRKVIILAVIFLFIVGDYWLLRTNKDALFMKITGAQQIPNAKLLSFCAMIPLVLLYSYLVDVVEKHVLFYIICGSYGVLFGIITLLLNTPALGLANTVASPDRWLGWLIYVSIETFGSLAVPLFWSFMNSISDSKTAKDSYGIIIMVGQIGSIGGPTLSRGFAKQWGIPTLTALAAATILVVPFLVQYFVTLYPKTRDSQMQKKTGPVEGLKLLFSHHYLKGILCVATVYEIIGTILDYQMKVQLNSSFETAAEVSAFMGSFGQWTNGVTLIFSMVGTSYVLRTFGLTKCLVAFPCCVAAVCVYVWLYPSINVLFYAMVAIKGFSYALNGPCKEILYIPTSKDVKFKVKGWIDMFGARAAKSLGSVVINFVKQSASMNYYTGFINLGICGFWAVGALYTGRMNKSLEDEGHTINGSSPSRDRSRLLEEVELGISSSPDSHNSE